MATTILNQGVYPAVKALKLRQAGTHAFRRDCNRRWELAPLAAEIKRKPQKKTEQTPQGEITRAEQLKKLWMKYRNRYTGSQKEREAILKELGL
jgi:hypothetical protein